MAVLPSRTTAGLVHLHHCVPTDLEEAVGIDRLAATPGPTNHLEGTAFLQAGLEIGLSLDSLRSSQIIGGEVRMVGGNAVVAVIVLLLKKLILVHGPGLDQDATVPGRPGEGSGLGLLGAAVKGAQGA